MTYKSYVQSTWIGTGTSSDPYRAKIVQDLQAHTWTEKPSWSCSDATGTPVEHIMPDPNGVILLFEGVNDPARAFIDSLPDALAFDWEVEEEPYAPEG